MGCERKAHGKGQARRQTRWASGNVLALAESSLFAPVSIKKHTLVSSMQQVSKSHCGMATTATATAAAAAAAAAMASIAAIAAMAAMAGRQQKQTNRADLRGQTAESIAVGA
jgi:hypothetical protein